MDIQMQLEDGYLSERYAKRCDVMDREGWACRRSFPFAVTGIPEGTRALGILYMDWDSIPVCGFPWIHWCAVATPAHADFDGTWEAPDDLSRGCAARIEQGYNSACKSEPGIGVGYVGPCPPDADHGYTLTIFALDEDPQLGEPFWASELVDLAREHALEEVSLTMMASC